MNIRQARKYYTWKYVHIDEEIYDVSMLKTNKEEYILKITIVEVELLRCNNVDFVFTTNQFDFCFFHFV